MITFRQVKPMKRIPDKLEKRIVSWTDSQIVINNTGFNKEQSDRLIAFFIGEGYEEI